MSMAANCLLRMTCASCRCGGCLAATCPHCAAAAGIPCGDRRLPGAPVGAARRGCGSCLKEGFSCRIAFPPACVVDGCAREMRWRAAHMRVPCSMCDAHHAPVHTHCCAACGSIEHARELSTPQRLRMHAPCCWCLEPAMNLPVRHPCVQCEMMAVRVLTDVTIALQVRAQVAGRAGGVGQAWRKHAPRDGGI